MKKEKMITEPSPGQKEKMFKMQLVKDLNT